MWTETWVTEGARQAKVVVWGEEPHRAGNIPERGSCRFQDHKQKEAWPIWEQKKDQWDWSIMEWVGQVDGVCGNRTRSLALEVMMGSLEFGNGKPLSNFKQRNLIQTLGSKDTLVNKTAKNPCPPVAYRLIFVSKRSLWLLHGERVIGEEQKWRQGNGLGAAVAVQGQGD